MKWVILFSLSIISAFTLADTSAVSQRIDEEIATESNYFVITPHKPNYLLPISYSRNVVDYTQYAPGGNPSQVLDPQHYEVKFQISFKTPIWDQILDSPFSLYFAYSQVSFWQAYNSAYSSPFRETNYEPELFLSWRSDIPIGDEWRIKLIDLSLVHQSNGRGGAISRSWNRLQSRIVFADKQYAISLRPWYRFPEENQDPNKPIDPSLDNNPDITDYLGHGEIMFAYSNNQHTFSLKSRNNLESGFSKGALEATWSFPLHIKMKGYIQAFSGYGQNLIEYDMYNTSIGIGFAMTDWL